MKKKLLFYVLFYCCLQNAFSQNMTKEQLTNDIYNVLYGNNSNPDDYPASSNPSTFIDLQEGSNFEKRAKLLSNLEFKDGISVLTRDNPIFRKEQIPYHASIIKALIEAWNIPLVTNGVSLPYSDVNSSTIYYELILTAYDIGMLDNTSQLKPEEGLDYNDALFYITVLSNSGYPKPSQSDLKKAKNYFIPNNYTAENLSLFRGMEQGVFNHYAKNSFVIPDRKMSLNFSHFYSTQLVELPDGYFPIQPLGRGWTHTYNSYIIREDNVIGSDDIYNVVWSDGTIHVYNEDEEKYISMGVYDEFNERSSTEIRITKKNQTRYRFKKLDSDRPIYYLIEIEDANGNEINIDYESAEEKDTKRIASVEAPSGKKLVFKYEKNTDLIERITDPIGRKLFFEYSDLWRGYSNTLVRFEDAKGNDTKYQYYTDRNTRRYYLKTVDLPRGNKIEAVYDNDNNGKLKRYTVNDNEPVEIEVKFDYGSSEPITSTVRVPMPKGGTQKYEYSYNEQGILTKFKNDTDDIQIDYPTSNNSPTPFLPTHTNTNGLEIDYDYDRRGNVEKIDIENGKSIEQYKYDSDNNVTEYIDPEGNTTKFSYDNDENLTEIEDANGNTINYSYDNYGQLLSVTNQEGITINYTYENDGAVSSITAPEDISSTFDYDEINRLIKKKANGLTTRYTYDKNDNITSFTNTGGYVTGYDYDKNDNITDITNIKGIKTSFRYNSKDQVTSETFGNLETKYRYNDDGSLKRTTKSSNDRISYKYDNDGRLKETGTITDIDYNNRNLIEDITNNTGKIAFKYDKLNRLERVTTVHGYKVEYDYEKTGLVEEIKYPTINGLEYKVDYSYDKKNRVSRVKLDTNDGNNGFYIAEYQYYDDDRIKHINLGNDIRIVYFYDKAGRHRFIKHENRTTDVVLYTGAHTLDNRGNIIKSTDYFTPIPPGYIPGNSPNSNSNDSYSYNDTNHLLTAKGISHTIDDDGNTTKIGNDISVNYDVDDRLTDYKDVDKNFEFNYNPYNQRVEKTVDGITTKYIRDVRLDNILVELDENNNSKYYYIYSPSGMLLARIQSNGDINYFHGDIRGSVVMLTDENAEITHQYRYDDFGSITRTYEPDNDVNQFRYVGIYGVEYDTKDLYYMRARYYKPSVGRFLTQDPIWSTNLYPYADNNPISRIDPNGKQSFHINTGDIGVCYSSNYLISQKIAHNSKSYVNSTLWNVGVRRRNFSPSDNKCNLFVYDMLKKSGVSPGLPNGRFKTSPPTAEQWADINYIISGWVIVTNPQPGDVAAEAINYEDATGHVAIVTGENQTTGTIGGLRIGSSDWGFRKSQKGRVVFRRYIGN